MAMPQLTLVFIGVLALFATLGLFYDFGDRWTSPLLGFSAAVLWGIFGISSFDVVIGATDTAIESDSIMPLVVIGLGLAFVVFILSVSALFDDTAAEARDTAANSALGR